MTVWKQERPEWCPHSDCIFKYRVMDSMCGGHLPKPAEHDGDFNHYRMCLNGASDNGGVFDLQINNTDIYWFGRVFDAVQGRPENEQTHKYENDDKRPRRTVAEMDNEC